MRSTLGRSARHTLWRLVLWYLSAGLIGWTLGRFWLALAIASTALVVWQYLRLWLTLDAVNSRRWIHVDEGEGLWAELVAVLSRSQRESRQRKRRLLDLVRAYRQTIAALPDGTVILDPGLRIQWFNEAATRLLNLQHPQDVGRLFTHLVRTPRIVDWLERRSEEPLLEVSTAANPTVQLSLRLIPYADGQWLLVVRDISKLTHLEQVRRDFVANVSHELRTPLTVIHGYLDMIEPEEYPDIEPMVLEMRRQSQRMAQIVEDLLTLSRLEAQEKVEEETVSMASMMDTLRREAEALSGGRHEVSCEDASPTDLQGCTKDLHSAFSNLVSNAVRYTPPGGRIMIRYAPEGDGVALAVTDTGQGIPPQHLPRVTERFYRVSTSRSRESGGTGLGLSIVKHVLNLHGGRLDVTSELGRGSTFRCIFGPERLRKRGQDDTTPEARA